VTARLLSAAAGAFAARFFIKMDYKYIMWIYRGER
jgi:hypothetical protein